MREPRFLGCVAEAAPVTPNPTTRWDAYHVSRRGSEQRNREMSPAARAPNASTYADVRPTDDRRPLGQCRRLSACAPRHLGDLRDRRSLRPGRWWSCASILPSTSSPYQMFIGSAGTAAERGGTRPGPYRFAGQRAADGGLIAAVSRSPGAQVVGDMGDARTHRSSVGMLPSSHATTR